MAFSDLNPFAARRRVKLVEGLTGVLGDSVEFDASKDEQHDGENEVTDFPVEEGSNITDHSRPKPRTVQVHGFVTTTPVSILNIATPASVKNTRPKTAYKQLEKWRNAGTVISVITTLFGYTSVVIQKLSVPRASNNSDGIEFTIVFKEVKTVSSRLVSKPVRSTKNDSLDTGGKPTAKVTPALADQNGSVLSGFVF